MRKSLSLLGLAALTFPLQLAAATLTINGVTYDGPGSSQFNNIKVVQDKDSVVITTDPVVLLDYILPIADADNVANDYSPVFLLSGRSFSVASGDTAIGSVEARDSDTGATTAAITYSISNDPSGLFQISTAGVVSLISGAVFNNPGNNIYFVEVTANDNDTAGANNAVTFIRVEVTDGSAPANTPPVFAGGNVYVYSVADGHTGAVGNITATDAEGAVNYALSGNDAADFSISSAGAITFNQTPDHGSPADADANNVYNFNVVATDVGSPPLSLTSSLVSITVAAPAGGGGACGSLPAGVTLGATTNLAATGSQQRVSMPGSQVVSLPVTTTANSTFSGYFQITSTTGNSNVSREAWFSTCPGIADDISRNSGTTECHATGTSTTNVKFVQNGAGDFRTCGLDVNSTFYLNIKNVNCTSGSCDVYRNVYTKGTP